MDTPMLTPLFDWILAASLRASLLTVVVLMAQAVLRHRVPARWRYALWLPVLMVLLMPMFPESSWSVVSITKMAPAPLSEPLPLMESVTSPTPSPVAAAAEAPVPIPWWRIARLAWLSGALGMVLFGLAAFMQTLRRLQRGRLPVSEALQREIAALAREVGLGRVPRVWVAAAIRSPAVAGLLRPTLLLPADFEQALTPHEARHVLKHELTHIKRGDLPVNALLCLLLALHWFNPLLWLAFFKVRLDREAACDSQVLHHANQSQRVAYGHTLLKVETAFSRHGLSLGFVGIFQRGAALRSRIRSIASQTTPHPLMKTTLTLGIALLTFLGVTKAAAPDPNTPLVYITTKFIEISEKNPTPANRTPLPPPLDNAKEVPGLIGTLTDPQLQNVIRGLSQLKGVDLMSAPSVTAKSGQQAKVEVVREFIRPAELGKAGKANKPVTPNPWVTLSVLPKIMDDGYQITLDVSSEVVEFEGFTNAEAETEPDVLSRMVLHADGSTTQIASEGKDGEVRESKFNNRGVLLSRTVVPSTKARKNAAPEPLFTVRKVKANETLAEGSTLVLEMELRTDTQLVEEGVEDGRVIKTSTDIFKRRLFVFVTARLVSPKP